MELRLERLVGRMVLSTDNKRIGRLEEVRAEQHGAAWIVTAFVLGRAGLAERLGVGARLLFGTKRPSGYVARNDQLDISDIEAPRLLCPVEELAKQ